MGWSAPELSSALRVDILAHSRTARNGLIQKRLEKGSLLNHPSCLPYDPISQGTELKWTEALRSHLELDWAYSLHQTHVPEGSCFRLFRDHDIACWELKEPVMQMPCHHLLSEVREWEQTKLCPSENYCFTVILLLKTYRVWVQDKAANNTITFNTYHIFHGRLDCLGSQYRFTGK